MTISYKKPARRFGVQITSLLTLSLASAVSSAQTLDYRAAAELFGEPVTAGVTGSPQRASDAPADLEIITADDIRRSGAYDIPGVLRHVAGIDVLQWTNNQTDIGIHGYDQAFSSGVLVLIDGRQAYADYYGYTPWSALPVELAAIQQIEVVRGPNSALFGFNAANGVINIITSDPLRDSLTGASVSVGTQGLAQLSAVGTFKLAEDLGLRVQIGGRRDDDFSTPIPPAVFGAARGADSRASIDVSVAMQATDALRLDLDLSHTAVDENEVPTVYVLVPVSYDTNSAMARAAADTSVGLLQAQLYSNWLTFTYPMQATGGTPGKFTNQVSVGRFEDIFKAGEGHTFRASLEYRHDTVATNPITGGHVAYDVFSAGGMWEWKLAPDLTATNAIRIDNLTLHRDGYLLPGSPYTNASWNRSIFEPTFNSGLVWRVSDVDTLRVIASRGAQLPSLGVFGGVQETNSALGLPVIDVGRPSLQPEIVVNWQAEWDRKLRDLGGALKVNLYHQTISSIVSETGAFDVTPSRILVSPANIGDSDATGLDIELSGHFAGDWKWSASYAGEIVTDHLTKGSLFAAGVDFQHTTPVHIVGASLGWHRGPWEVDGFLRYQSAIYGLTSRLDGGGKLARIDDYVTLDGRIAYRLNDRMTLSLSGQNLTASHQMQTSGPDVERRVFGTVSIGF